MISAADEDWSVLTSLFPAGWREQAKLSGALSRRRGVSEPEALLRMLLLHIGSGCSLRETTVRARTAGWAAISDVALLKRLRSAEEWLCWLCQELMAENRIGCWDGSSARTMRIVHATVVREPGRTGSQWRMIYSLRLPELCCDYFDITATHGPGTGESFTRVPVQRGDLLLGDAGYAAAGSIESVVRRGGDALLRINLRRPLLEDRRGRKFNCLSRFKRLSVPGAMGEWRVRLSANSIEGRVCAVRKSATATARALRRLDRRQSKKQTRIQPQTREFAGYVVVFTTDQQAPAKTVLEWYRIRWQIELLFKRIKSLAQLGHLPKRDPQSSRAWLYGKLLVALLAQKLTRLGCEFSPWGYVLPPAPPTE